MSTHLTDVFNENTSTVRLEAIEQLINTMPAILGFRIKEPRQEQK